MWTDVQTNRPTDNSIPGGAGVAYNKQSHLQNLSMEAVIILMGSYGFPGSLSVGARPIRHGIMFVCITATGVGKADDKANTLTLMA